MTQGMFGDMFAPARPDLDEETRLEQMHQAQARDPFNAMARTSYGGGTLAGQGLARAGAAFAGEDPRTRGEKDVARKTGAAEAVRAAVVGLKPGTDEYFAKVIEVLHAHGLVEQAAALQQQWEKSKLMTAQTGAYDRAHVAKPPTPLKGKDFLLGKYDELTAKLAEDPDNVEYQTALANVETALKKFYPDAKPAAKWKVVPPTQDSPGYRYDEVSGEVEQLDGRLERPVKPVALTAEQQRKADEGKQKMISGYDSALISAQSYYDDAVALYNHPDLEGAVGAFNSAISDTPPNERGFLTRALAWTKSPGEARAIALLSSVKAGAFLTGFQEIKAAAAAQGAQGAGFGALSDAEGARIQAAKATLDGVQNAAGLRIGLKKYIGQMVESWNAISKGMEPLGVAPKPIAEKPLTAGVRAPRGRPAAPAATPKTAPAAPAAPAAPTAPSGGEERWERKNGKLQRVG
jgi:hypothetical protein